MPTKRKADIKLKGRKIGPGILTGSELRALKARARLKKLKKVVKRRR